MRWSLCSSSSARRYVSTTPACRSPCSSSSRPSPLCESGSREASRRATTRWGSGPLVSSRSSCSPSLPFLAYPPRRSSCATKRRPNQFSRCSSVPPQRPPAQAHSPADPPYIKVSWSRSWVPWPWSWFPGLGQPGVVLLLGTVVLSAFYLREGRLASQAYRGLVMAQLDLIDAAQQIKTLHGIVPIFAHCKNIRDDTGFWENVASYVQKRTEAEFSHSICPECAAKYYPELSEG